MPGQVLSMGELGWQPHSAVVEPRKADAEGMGARAAFEPRMAGLMGWKKQVRFHGCLPAGGSCQSALQCGHHFACQVISCPPQAEQ